MRVTEGGYFVTERPNYDPVAEQFIDRLVNDAMPTNIYLINGLKLYSGIITANGPTSTIYTSDKGTQLVMKHAIATIVPGEANWNRE